MTQGFSRHGDGVPNIIHANDINELQLSLERRAINVKDPQFGAVGDGVANDSAAITAAIAALGATGGTIVFPPGSYKAAVAITDNKRICLTGYGATWVVAASTIGLAINQGSGASALGVQVVGFSFEGNDGASTTAIQIKNSDRVSLRDLRIEDCTTGIHLLSTTSGGWVEETSITHSLVSSCTAGILFETTGSGTGSFSETHLGDVGINDCAIGIRLGVGGILYRTRFDGVTIWSTDNQTGFLVEGDVLGSSFYVGFESLGTPTAITGLNLATGTFNQQLAEWILNFTGAFTNKIVLSGSLALEWRQGSVTGYVSGDGRLWRAYRATDSDPRFSIATEFTGGGGILLGPGNAGPDVSLYRKAANVLKTDDAVELAPGIAGAAGAPLKFVSGVNLTAPEAGAAEFDGKAFYLSAVAGARQVVPAEQFVCLASDFTLSAASGAQNVFPAANDVLTVAALTAYFFDGFLYLTTGTTTHTTAFGFAGTATLTSILYWAEVFSGAAVAIVTAGSWLEVVSAASTVLNATSTAASTKIKLRGVVRVNGAGTLIPQINFSANPTGTNLTKTNSWMRLSPVGDNAVAAVGNWT